MPEYKPTPLNEVGVRSFNYPGHGERLSETLGLAHAQVIPAGAHQVHIVGQLGNEDDSSFPSSYSRQIELTFANVEKALHSAGVTNGWQQVYSVTFYCAPAMGEEEVATFQKCRDQYLDKNRPSITGIAVAAILLPGAFLEMSVNAVVTSEALARL